GQAHLAVDGALLAGPMSGPYARKAAGLGFDHRAEGIVAQSSLLLGCLDANVSPFVGGSKGC
ncbi:hypothetical protein, partial [Xanthomonas hortorum]|uniref:hypothetical protein n=1 Tax=Xanthomonas hortorum TaxID=56454 RepID=UPI001CA567CF